VTRTRSSRSARAGVALIAAAALVVAAPSASAAVQLGETFTPPASQVCDGSTQLQTLSGAPDYDAPFDGVITAWSYRSSALAAQVKLKIGRFVSNTGPFGPSNYFIVGESAQTSPPVNQLTTYADVRIPVQAGDVIGSRVTGGGCVRMVMTGHAIASNPGDLAPGSTASFTATFSRQLDIAATLEPDADNDGFGDETQDACPGAAGPLDGCPIGLAQADRTLTLDANKGKVEKGRKVRLSGQLDAPQNEPACEPNQAVELQRRKKKAPDSAFSTFDTIQTDATGNFSAKEKVKKTYVYRAAVAETEACDDETSNSQKVRVQKKKPAKQG
jgi:hypothetical protein